jgi:pilus assembly protein Flp/PilA
MKAIRRFLADESGATSIEYAIIACGIAVVIITAVNGIGVNVRNRFTAMSTALK